MVHPRVPERIYQGHGGEARRGLWDFRFEAVKGPESDRGGRGIRITESGAVDRTVRRHGYLHFCFAHAVPRPSTPFYFSVRATPTHPSKPSPSLPRVLQAEWALPPRGSLSPAPIPRGTGHLVCPSLDRELLESGTVATPLRKPSPGPEAGEEAWGVRERGPQRGPSGRRSSRPS